jgi:hypothetical protein
MKMSIKTRGFRVHARYKPIPLTYSSGTVRGEQEITSSTTAPTLDTHGFEIAPDEISDDDGNTGKAFHPPEFLDVIGELSGTAADDTQLAVSIWFFFPDASTTNKWRESAPLVISGVNYRGAKGSNDKGVTQGNLYKVDCPAGATRAFVHVDTMPADVDLHVMVHPYNN